MLESDERAHRPSELLDLLFVLDHVQDLGVSLLSLLELLIDDALASMGQLLNQAIVLVSKLDVCHFKFVFDFDFPKHVQASDLTVGVRKGGAPADVELLLVVEFLVETTEYDLGLVLDVAL